MKQIRLGDLTATRDFNFVKDVCSGFLVISKCDNAIGKEINIASNHEISMFEILNLIKELMNSDVEFIADQQRVRPLNSEVTRLLGDGSLLKRLTGFEPKYNIREGLKITCEWFHEPENIKKYKTEIYNL
jgi:nucleoside-diphosphate-sugar epimerase